MVLAQSRAMRWKTALCRPTHCCHHAYTTHSHESSPKVKLFHMSLPVLHTANNESHPTFVNAHSHARVFSLVHTHVHSCAKNYPHLETQTLRCGVFHVLPHLPVVPVHRHFRSFPARGQPRNNTADRGGGKNEKKTKRPIEEEKERRERRGKARRQTPRCVQAGNAEVLAQCPPHPRNLAAKESGKKAIYSMMRLSMFETKRTAARA